MKKENITEREIWVNILKNPKEYVKSIKYVAVSVACLVAFILVQVACSGGK